MKTIKTINYCIKFGLNFLKSSNKTDHDNIALDTRILLAHVLKIEPKQLLFMLDHSISLSQFDEFKTLLNIRYNGKPVYKIIGEKPFFKNTFLTNNDVLDPRTDTETLVEAVLEQYNFIDNINVFEFGTGSGCIILSILSELKNVKGYAIDVSKSAIQTAKKNASLLKLDNAVNFYQKNWNDLCNLDFQGTQFDCIISNPPYIKTLDINNLSDEVKNFDPKIALDGGQDGLKCYKEIASVLQNRNIKLSNTAKIFLEIGNNQSKAVKQIFEEHGFKFIGLKNDLNNIPRTIIFSV